MFFINIPICNAQGGDYDEFLGYQVTVPAQLSPGESGIVSVSGTLDSSQQLVISTDNYVRLSYNDQTIDVSVLFEDLIVRGKDSEQITCDSTIRIAEQEVMFGTWTGVINYSVSVEAYIPTVTIDKLGTVTTNNPNALFTFNPDNGDANGIVPPSDEPETPDDIPESQLPELIDFNYGTVEKNVTYAPGEWVEVPYETSYTTTKYPVAYQRWVWSKWNVTKVNDEIVNTVACEISLSDISNKHSEYLLYDFETDEYLELNGVKGDSVELWVIYSNEKDTKENIIYLAAYLNKLEGKNPNRHVAKWDGEKYVTVDYDVEIDAIDVFTTTYTIKGTQSVQVREPSSIVDYIYIPAGTLKAEKDMTWREWINSSYNTIGHTNIIIKTPDYNDVSLDDKIVAGEEYAIIPCVLDGLWYFNETLIPYISTDNNADMSQLIEYVNFKSNGDNYTAFDTSHHLISTDLLYYGEDTLTVYGDGWDEEETRYVDFGKTPQMVSPEFYEWFTTNATKQEFILSGTWKWNDEIDMIGYSDLLQMMLEENDCVETPIYLHFTSNNTEFTYLYEQVYSAHGSSLVYGNDTTTTPALNWTEEMWDLDEEETFEWTDESYKIIDFSFGQQEVSRAFYEWFIANASPFVGREVEGIITKLNMPLYFTYIDGWTWLDLINSEYNKTQTVTDEIERFDTGYTFRINDDGVIFVADENTVAEGPVPSGYLPYVTYEMLIEDSYLTDEEGCLVCDPK